MQYPVPSLASAALALTLAGAPLFAHAAAPSQAAAPVAPAPDQVALRGTPAAVGGTWCGAGLLREFTLEIAQHYQDIQARLIRKNRIRNIAGRVDGMRVRTEQRNETMDLLVDGDELRIVGATGVLALAKGQFFTRAAGARCTH